MTTQSMSTPQAYMLAQSLQQRGEHSKAAQIYQSIMQQAPRDTTATLQLARILLKAGQAMQAQQVLASRFDYAKENFEYLYLLGALSLQSRKLPLALAATKAALSQQPESAQTYNLLGSVQLECSNFEAAIEAFQRATEIAPNFADPYNNLAWAYRATGESEQAIKNFAKAYKLEPRATEALSGLLMLKQFESVDSDMREAESVVGRPDLAIHARTELHFSLGKAYEDCCDYDQAFAHFERGNQLWRTTLDYSIEQDRELFKAIRDSVYDASELSVDPDTPTPIFVLGMPRSSTSLVEQILASHSQVWGAGELPTLTDLLLNGSTFTWTPERKGEIRKQYLDYLSSIAQGKAFVVDKMPQNFRFIGVILSCFPEAKIVHCKRDARDNCLSLFKHHFPMTQHNYAYDINELAEYHALYRELMTHWQQLAPTRIFTLEYEHLIDHFETDVRAMLAHLKIDFEPACLEFQKTKRAIRTASSEQVRKGLYKSGARQWQHYSSHLGALFDRLQ